MKSKSSEEVLANIKTFIKEVGKPQLMQSDNGGEFKANIIIDFMKEENIFFINSSPYHPQTNVVVEAFNKNIINKLEYVLLDKNNNFDIKLGLEKANEIYNNTIHTSTKIEPIKAINFKDEKLIEQVIKNIIKSQSNKFGDYQYIIKKGDKCLLNNTYIKKGNNLSCKPKKKGMYIYPIIIEKALGATKYSFKFAITINDFDTDTIYNADYKLIKNYL